MSTETWQPGTYWSRARLWRKSATLVRLLHFFVCVLIPMAEARGSSHPITLALVFPFVFAGMARRVFQSEVCLRFCF